jgi:surface polysaccharide O-acyltransferase-like enzyme
MKVEQRIAFLDYLRVIACFMVVLAHCCEPFYFSDNGGCFLRSASDAIFLAAFVSACVACVPLFVMASSYLLFPVTKPTGEFLKRRFSRIFIPFLVWSCVYCAYSGGGWKELLFNFPMCGAHMWFIPMLMGLYFVMPVISPWAQRLNAREIHLWLVLWLFTTAFPFIRKLAFYVVDGAGGGPEPFLWGESLWNDFGGFHYVSGFIGYVLLGFYFRKFVPELSWKRTLLIASPLWIAGWIFICAVFFCRLPLENGYPIEGPLSLALDLELGWRTCTTGVAMTAAGAFLVIRKLNSRLALYRNFIKPLATASYGTYLAHMLVLVPVLALIRPHFSTPVSMLLSAVVTFVLASLISIVLRRIPLLGRFIAP